MTDKQILWLAPEIWAVDGRDSYHITNQLRKTYPILYCNSIGIRRPALKGSDIAKAISRIKKIFYGAKEVNPNLWVYSPFDGSLDDGGQ